MPPVEPSALYVIQRRQIAQAAAYVALVYIKCRKEHSFSTVQKSRKLVTESGATEQSVDASPADPSAKNNCLSTSQEVVVIKNANPETLDTVSSEDTIVVLGTKEESEEEDAQATEQIELKTSTLRRRTKRIMKFYSKYCRQKPLFLLRAHKGYKSAK